MRWNYIQKISKLFTSNSLSNLRWSSHTCYRNLKTDDHIFKYPIVVSQIHTDANFSLSEHNGYILKKDLVTVHVASLNQRQFRTIAPTKRFLNIDWYEFDTKLIFTCRCFVDKLDIFTLTLHENEKEISPVQYNRIWCI